MSYFFDYQQKNVLGYAGSLCEGTDEWQHTHSILTHNRSTHLLMSGRQEELMAGL